MKLQRAEVLSTDMLNATANASTFFTYKKICRLVNVKLSLFAALSTLKLVNGKYRKLVTNFISNPKILKLLYVNLLQLSYKLLPKTSLKLFNCISKAWFEKIGRNLKQGTYFFTKLCSKTEKKSINLSIFQDALIETFICLLLKRIFEKRVNQRVKLFNNFIIINLRQFTLLKIKKYWTAIPWYIEFDIKNEFTLLNRRKLMTLLARAIQDAGFFSLLNKLFNCRLITLGNIFKASTLSNEKKNLAEVLCNLYFNELDVFIDVLIKEYCKGSHPTKNGKYCEYVASNTGENLCVLKKERNQIRAQKRKEAFTLGYSSTLTDGAYVRVKYVRYLENFVVGIRARKIIALKIKNRIVAFLKSELHFKFHELTTKLIHSYYTAVNFLGITIKNILPKNLPYFTNRQQESMQRRKLFVVNKIKQFHLHRYKKFRATLHKKLGKNILQDKLALLNFVKNLKKKSIVPGKITQRQLFRFFISWTVKKKTLKAFVSAAKNPLSLFEKRKNLFYTFLKFQTNFTTTATAHIKKKFSNFLKKRNMFIFLQQLIWTSLFNERLQIRTHTCIKATYFFSIYYIQTLQKSKKLHSYSPKYSSSLFKVCNVYKNRRALSPRICVNLKDIFMYLKKEKIVSVTHIPISKNTILNASDYKIIQYYKFSARLLLDFYRCCDNLKKIRQIVNYHLKLSLFRTLQNKHKLTAKKTNSIYGSPISCFSSRGIFISFFTQIQLLKIKKEFLLYTRIPDLNQVFKKLSFFL